MILPFLRLGELWDYALRNNNLPVFSFMTRQMHL